MHTLRNRVDDLEREHGSPLLIRLIINKIVTPGDSTEPVGIRASPPYLPAVDRMPDETWKDFELRLLTMIGHLPPSIVVSVISRDAPEST